MDSTKCISVFCPLLAEGPADGLGLQECEEPRECVRPHVSHGNDVPDHHGPHSGPRQVLHSHSEETKYSFLDLFVLVQTNADKHGDVCVRRLDRNTYCC